MVQILGSASVDQSTISDIARGVLALDIEQDKLLDRQLALAQEQFKIFLRLEAITAARESLWRNFKHET